MRTMNYENYMKELQIQESMARLTSQQLVTASDCKMLPGRHFCEKKAARGPQGTHVGSPFKTQLFGGFKGFLFSIIWDVP